MARSGGWWIALGAVLLMCLGMMTYIRDTRKMLDDSDTTLIVSEIEYYNDPARWFTHDWPLMNHFYRPLSTLLFEYDDRVHRDDTNGWQRTTALLCVLTTLGFFWFLRELTDSPLISTSATFLFYLWQIDAMQWLVVTCQIVTLFVLVGGVWFCRGKPGIVRRMDRALKVLVLRKDSTRRWRAFIAILWRSLRRAISQYRLYFTAILLWWALSLEAPGMERISWRMMAWIPGRTASSMTVFAFIALAAFTRYLRLSPRRPVKATAVDVPNTRHAMPPAGRSPSVLWPILTSIATVGALLCYEQGVMVPALCGLLAVAFYFRGTIVRWLWGVPFGLTIVAYALVRHAFIPPGESWYFHWQRRANSTSLWMLQQYLFPFALNLRKAYAYALLSPDTHGFSVESIWELLNGAASFTALWQARRYWFLASVAWLGSVLAYGPMAWFRDFEHYHYFPMAFRALWFVIVLWVALEVTFSAVSPRARQAPQRLSPAPGSLPRR